jgi:hypothetical protein
MATGRRGFSVLIALALFWPARAAADCYYMAVFSADTKPDLARYSHTFAFFAKVADGPPGTPRRIEVRTISWLPKSLVLRPLRPSPEPGVNLPLEETIRWTLDNRARITVWGPFQIQPELYQRALCRAAYLESGAIAYKVIDIRYRPYQAADCIHGLSGVDLDRGILLTRGAYGDPASYMNLVHLSRWIIDPTCRHEWLLQEMGLNRYPLERRGWGRQPERLEYEPLPAQVVACKRWR